MSNIRIHKNKNFVTINTKILRDTNLSWSAKGLLSFILAFGQNNDNLDDIFCQYLNENCFDNSVEILTILNELIKNKYCKIISIGREKVYFFNDEFNDEEEKV